MSNEFEFEIVKGSFSLKVRGLKPAVQVSQYLADAVGVIGEPLGYVKDSLQQFRIHRAQASAAAMLRAKEIAESKGEKIKSVTPKLLAPWIEYSSREEVNEENLLELWAQILASAPEGFDSNYLAFMELCSRIGPREAEFIKILYNSGKPKDGWSIPHGITGGNMDKAGAICAQLRLGEVALFDTELSSPLPPHDHTDATLNANRILAQRRDQLVKEALKDHPMDYASVLCVTLQEAKAGVRRYIYPSNASVNAHSAFDISDVLIRQGAAELVNYPQENGHVFQFVQLTRFGFLFAHKCMTQGIELG